MCDFDQLSIIEIGYVFKECGVSVGFLQTPPHSEMDVTLFLDSNSNADVVEMCKQLSIFTHLIFTYLG